jgi:methylenetetrahydrofolate/methylenetetrahydromethanopterin dehydrogenase (NADP+)
VLRHGGVSVADVRALVYGLIFTRGIEDLARSAIFIGGSSVQQGEILLREAQQSFMGPLRVSVMLDSNGANTTAAAAVLAAARHVDLARSRAVVLAATGPVGSRAASLLALAGAETLVASRSLERAQAACRTIVARYPQARVMAVATESTPAENVLAGAQVVIAAGAPGVELVSEATRMACPSLKVAIDLSAIPPAGIAGIEPPDKAQGRDGCVCYGAIGVGGLKMKIHKAAIRHLFTTRDQTLDVEQIFAIARQLAE